MKQEYIYKNNSNIHKQSYTLKFRLDIMKIIIWHIFKKVMTI